MTRRRFPIGSRVTVTTGPHAGRPAIYCGPLQTRGLVGVSFSDIPFDQPPERIGLSRDAIAFAALPVHNLSDD